MIKFSKSIITKIFILAVVGLVFTKVFFLTSKDSIPGNSDLKTSVMNFSHGLEQFWLNGPSHTLLDKTLEECSDIPNALINMNKEVFKCNPSLLLCYLKNKHYKKHWLGFEFLFDSKSFKIMEKGDIQVSFYETVSKKSFNIELKRSCHKINLPEKVFSAGARNFSNELWDSYRQNIKVDQFYVSEYEYNLIENKNIKMNKDSSLPKLDLSLSQMRLFCKRKGGQLLKNHVFEALSFFPSKVNNGFMFKSKVPWAKTLNLQEEESSSKYCSHFISKECDISRLAAYTKASPGWLPIYHLLGSELEAFDNTFKSKQNLKVSSRYFNMNHESQKNAYRIYWNGDVGENFKVSSPKLSQLYHENIIKGVAFRCMY